MRPRVNKKSRTPISPDHRRLEGQSSSKALRIGLSTGSGTDKGDKEKEESESEGSELHVPTGGREFQEVVGRSGCWNVATQRYDSIIYLSHCQEKDQ